MLYAVANHAREDVTKVSGPKAQALFETSTEALKGLAKVFEDFEQKNEKTWRRFGYITGLIQYMQTVGLRNPPEKFR